MQDADKLSAVLTVIVALFGSVSGDPVNRTITMSPFEVITIREDLAEETILTEINCTLTQIITDPYDPSTTSAVPTSTTRTTDLCPSCNIEKMETDISTFLTGFVTELDYVNKFKVYNRNDGFFNNNRFYVVFEPNRGAPLDYDRVRTFKLTIDCHDDNDPSTQTTRATQILEIDILPNNPPAFNHPSIVTITLDAQNAGQQSVGTVVFEVSASDNESDTITFSMTVDPPSVDYFQINEQTGVITMAKNLLTATVTPVTLLVNATDGRHNIGPLTIVVNINNLNPRPSIANLPTNITIREDASIDDIVERLVFNTASFGIVQEDAFSVFPIAAAGQFKYRSADNTIRVADKLDAEGINWMNLTFTLFDGYLYSVDEYVIVTVSNVNEPPFFDKSVHVCTLLESNVCQSIEIVKT